MPTKRGTMTGSERAFVEAYVQTGNAQYAGEKAGYAAPAPSASKALARPAIQAEIVKRTQERLTNELLPLAVDCLHRLITDRRTPAGAAFNAAKYVVDRGLGAAESAQNGKEPHEMTGDELRTQLERLRREAAERSGKVIDVTPIKEPAPAGIFE